MDTKTKDIVTVLVIGAFTLTVCALVLFHAITNSDMDALEQTLVMVLIALAAALGGIQLPTVLGKSKSNGDKDAGPRKPPSGA